MAETQTSVETEKDSAAQTAQPARKRPRLEMETEPRKKTRSVFGQVFGTLRKAREDDNQLKTSDAAKKRSEIDDEAKRDRHSANRKEEDLTIKDSIMKFKQEKISRLSGFLLTSDVFPNADSRPEPEDSALTSRPSSPTPRKKVLAHPPPISHPPPLYYLPAILTPNQAKFLEEQTRLTSEIMQEESREWADDKKKGLEEIAELRRKAAEALNSAAEASKARTPTPPPLSADAAVAPEETMEVEEKVGESVVDGEPTLQQPKDVLEEKRAPQLGDGEDTIEY